MCVTLKPPLLHFLLYSLPELEILTTYCLTTVAYSRIDLTYLTIIGPFNKLSSGTSILNHQNQLSMTRLQLRPQRWKFGYLQLKFFVVGQQFTGLCIMLVFVCEHSSYKVEGLPHFFLLLGHHIPSAMPGTILITSTDCQVAVVQASKPVSYRMVLILFSLHLPAHESTDLPLSFVLKVQCDIV
ncbi:hypothetical protein VNO77_23875 [Canavalia gladiata]|uniref:Uncharacterized protein n=1 Tax=Canavalia gladiata TaxID=3824 RepID=A0AAN9L573_CANGL